MNEKNERFLINSLCNVFDVSDGLQGASGDFSQAKNCSVNSVEAGSELILNHPNATCQGL